MSSWMPNWENLEESKGKLERNWTVIYNSCTPGKLLFYYLLISDCLVFKMISSLKPGLPSSLCVHSASRDPNPGWGPFKTIRV